MLILSLDTSIRGCSVALHANGLLLAAYELHTERSSSSMLTTLIKNVVEQAGYTLQALDAIAVAKGPGSYTGLRVGVSTAKGLCYALDKPLIGIPTLMGMAAQLAPLYPANYLFCPMIDARRMEVYAAVYDTDLQTVMPTQAVILDELSIIDVLNTQQPIIFFGDGAHKAKAGLSVHPQAFFPSVEIQPSARTIGPLATEAFQQQQFEDVASFEPYYLKDFMGTKPRKKMILPD
ncbi:tRNA (adenosine(37)-N6)-threonylcarbamoyltransferase complex dimerization subunit type 1 TsaB [Arundinibacter roseus]|uniref:tRNA (Adenosine(37)-N6)-threonylcarbamoyltransferase complex dimerization subunit type 1 TsaB n=1 Tax=Arundinibacter roseus TaxID=2070510 RepID=A0A4R4KA01_9BACT|nr:tRNA (adenosine(37)-N6)-threonylcarbamoyltransferase complex dimerization subunit type 1 TsaB [Arundinibacter roseus]TDB63346.1 tRNA (adenosine(37)-N6)-threonylcarbamoyltransferase complex dimerization subunit type 1 TsaB [Arundinibacter roseus]